MVERGVFWQSGVWGLGIDKEERRPRGSEQGGDVGREGVRERERRTCRRGEASVGCRAYRLQY